MQRAAVCVIVPVWGAEKTLHRCVDSILCQQAEGGVCCVLVDDGSPDRCGAICDEYAAKDSRVTVIHQEDLGVSAARNAGLNAADADFIVFLDADDALRPGALQAALTAQQQAPGDFVLWHYTTEETCPDPVTGSARRAGPGALARLYLDCLIAMPWNKLYRTDLAKSLRFDSAYCLGEDLQFVLDYIALLGKTQPGFAYRVLESALTFYDCSRDGTLSTRYHSDYCDIWPEHFAKLNRAVTAAHAPEEDLLPLWRAEVRVFAEGVADILRRDPGEPPARLAKARTALQTPWLRQMLDTMKAKRCYSPYYLPLRLRRPRLIYRMAEAARTGSPLFGKLDWAGYYLLGGSWHRA